MSGLEKERKYYKTVLPIANTEYGKQVMRNADVLNSKISALLTHVSIMIAILMIFYNSANVSEANLDTKITAMTIDAAKSLMIVETCMYIVASLFCVLGIWITGPSSFLGHEDNPTDRLIDIIGRRRKCFIIALWITIFVTVTFLVTLLIELLLINKII